MIEQVDAVIAAALKKELQRFGWGNKVDVQFSEEQEKGREAVPTVIFSLRSVTENAALRAEPFHYNRKPNENGSSRKRTPFYFDLNYVIATRAVTPEQQHMLLGHVLASLLLNPTLVLPAPAPDGEARDLMLSVARPPGEHSFALLPTDRMAIGPTITLVVTAPLQPYEDQPVTLVYEGLFAVGQRRGEAALRQPADVRSIRVSGTGVVKDAASGKPVYGAVVAVKAENQSVLTDESGRFVLLNLRPGEHQIEVNAPGFVPMVKKLVSPKPGRVQDLVDEEFALVALDVEGLTREVGAGDFRPLQHRSLNPERAGKLSYPDGRPAAYLPVYCGSASTVTSADGIYFLTARANEKLFVEIPGIGRVEITGSVVEAPTGKLNLTPK